MCLLRLQNAIIGAMATDERFCGSDGTERVAISSLGGGKWLSNGNKPLPYGAKTLTIPSQTEERSAHLKCAA